jgi:hypothetical protein
MLTKLRSTLRWRERGFDVVVVSPWIRDLPVEVILAVPAV